MKPMTELAFPPRRAAAAELRLRLPATPASLTKIRAQLGAFLDEQAVGDKLFFEALLVAHELAANAIEHGSGPWDEIELRVALERERLCITAIDEAKRASIPVALSPDARRERGRGLQVVGRLADWSEHLEAGRRHVRAELLL